MAITDKNEIMGDGQLGNMERMQNFKVILTTS